MASESEALLLDVGSQLMKADEEELEPHHRPWPWRGARCWLAGFVFWLLYCGTVLPHFHAMWGERKFKGAPAWRLMLMVPTGGIILPSLALLAHRVDGCHLSLEEWADQWARSWRPSFRGIRPQTDFSWVFLGAITAVFLVDFQLFEMAWPMKVHHVTSLVLVYLFSFVVSTGHPYALTTAAALEVGTAVSNTFYLSGQAAFMRIPYAVVMTFSNGWGECHPHGAPGDRCMLRTVARDMHSKVGPIFGRGSKPRQPEPNASTQ